MSAEQNKSIIYRWVQAGWNEGNLDLADELYGSDYVYHDPMALDLGTGPEAIKRVVQTYRGALPDIHFTVDEMVAEGDKVAWRWTARGTHQGPLLNFPPTGKTATVTGTVISRFAGGKWVEDYNHWDTLGMLQQMGIIPSMGGRFSP